MRARGFLLAGVAVVLLIGGPYSRAEQSSWPGLMTVSGLRRQGFEPLIDGGSLDQWDLRPWHEGHWGARDGVIEYDGKGEHKRFNENNLWTEASFADFTLYAQWRLPREPRMAPHPIVLFNGDFLRDEQGKRVTRMRHDAGDSGVLLRGVLKCQANIWSQELGSGEVNGYRTDRSMPPEVRRACIPIRAADRAAGEWNTFLISVVGSRMMVALNGQQVIDVELPDLPTSGPIGLQHHGDPVQFRHVWVKAAQ